ncbi:MAG: hypothetical protein K8T20_04245 [Planctomycetes bacterium]|nr:hypothetical protein [Planctomycetota bacterium]
MFGKSDRAYLRGILLCVVIFLAGAGIMASVDAVRMARVAPPVQPPALRPHVLKEGPKASSVRTHLQDDHWAQREWTKKDDCRISTYLGQFPDVFALATVVSRGCQVGMLSYTLSWDAALQRQAPEAALAYVSDSLHQLSIEAAETAGLVLSRAMNHALAADLPLGEPVKDEMRTHDGWVVQGTAIMIRDAGTTRFLISVGVRRADLPDLALPPAEK